MLTIGHKGAAGLAIGNTLEAIQAGLDAGADMIEIDIRTTKDGIAILCHDKKIGHQLINSTTYPSLIKTNNNLATLDQAIKLVQDKAKLLLDIKPGQDPEAILSVINKYKKASILVTSFDLKVLEYIHNDSPDIKLAVLDRWSGVRASYHARKFGTKIIIMNHKWLWRGFIRSVSNSNYELYAYTLNDPKKAQKWAKSGLSGVVTDYPDRF